MRVQHQVDRSFASRPSRKIVEICINFANKKGILIEFSNFSEFLIANFLISFLEKVHLYGFLGGILAKIRIFRNDLRFEFLEDTAILL